MRHFGTRFNDEQLIELGKARERLNTYMRKVQPYLPELYPEESKPVLSGREASQPWQKEQWQSVQQLRAMNLHLNKQVKELLVKKKKAQSETPSNQTPEGESRVDITRKLYPNA